MRKSFLAVYIFESFLFSLLVLTGLQIAAQPTTKIASYNTSSFTKPLIYTNTEKLNAIATERDQTNPDFGKIAPGVKPEWYEQYSKRTATSRNFVTEDGAVVYGYSYAPINYPDKNGNYIAINPCLSPSANGWSATCQEFPTFLNRDGSTEISLGGNDRLSFNVNNSISGNAVSLNNYTVGDNGMMIYNAIQGVDKRIIVKENKIETDYLLNKPLTAVPGDLVISEEIILPEGYSIKEKNLDELFGVRSNRFEMVVLNKKGAECAHFKMPVCYDSNRDKSKREQSFCFGKYILRKDGGRIFLKLVVPSSWLNDPARIYPVTIDPQVTGPTSTWAGGDINSCFSPASSTATINVTVPGKTTITNFWIEGSYYADPNTFTYISDGGLFFTTPCGSTDTATQNLNSSGTLYISPMYDMIAEGACCYSPSCSAQTIPLSMHLIRTYGAGGCNALYIYYDMTLESPAIPFSAYIVGRTAEATYSVAPTSVCSNVCTLTLSVTANYGVPPYTVTHSWASSGATVGAYTTNSCTSTGAATLTLNIPGNCPSTCGSFSNLSVPAPVIVDACGTIVSGLTATNVSQKPVPVVTPNPISTSVCSGLAVDILNTACVAGSTINWAGSDGSSGSGNLEDFPVNSGSSNITVNYTITATAGGCPGTPVIVPITVYPAPTVSISPTSPAVCGGQSAVLTVSGAKTYLWSPSNGLSSTSGATVSANPSSSTTYTVTGTDVNGCTSSSTVTVTIRSAANITVSPRSSSICSGQSVPLTANGGVSYSWGPSSGLSATTGANVSASPGSTTTYTVTGTDANGCTNTATSTITISTSFTISAGPDLNICPGGSTPITVTGAPGGSTYTWTPSANLTCNNCSNPTANPASTTTYIVKATSPSGCSGQDTIVIIVTPLSANATPVDTLVCPGSMVQLNASGGTNYSWTPSTALSDTSSASPVAFPLATTTYTVTVSNGSCSSTATVAINTFPSLPTPTITQKGDSLFCSTDPKYTSYQWYFNSTILNGATDTIYVASQSGNYNVAVHDENGCFISVGINITINGISELNASGNDAVTIYPNPAGNQFEIRNSKFEIKNIVVYNLLGERCYQSEVSNSQSVVTLNVSSLSSGIYFLQLEGSEGRWIGKFVKE